MSTNRPDNPRLSKHRASQLRQAILTEVGLESAHATPSRRRRSLTALAIAATSVVVVGGAAAAWVTASRPDDPYSVYCSPNVTTDPDVWKRHGASTVTNADTGVRSSLDAIGACSTMWRTGTLPGDVGHDNLTGSGAVPTLTACVVEGHLVVYPGPAGVCHQLQVPAAGG